MTIDSVVAPVDSEAANLFNPAFCSLLLHKATAAYEAKAGSAMPVTLAFLILPSALHKPTRDALPSTTATSMWSWIRTNPMILVDFVARVQTFRPYTANAITYGIRQFALEGALGSLSAGTLKRRPRTLLPTDDWLSCVRAAEFFGKWFGVANTDQATTLAHWGVRP